MRVLIQLRATQAVLSAAEEDRPTMTPLVEEAIPGVEVDSAYAPVEIPTPQPVDPGATRFSLSQPLTFSTAPQDSTYVIRGTLSDDPATQRMAFQEAMSRPEVVGVFSDPVIENSAICPQRPIGNAQDVATNLSVNKLRRNGMEGQGVVVAVVDSGINLAHLRSVGRDPTLNRRQSWTPSSVSSRPGRHPVGHGTMCAFDVGIAAPKATLLDHSLLLTRRGGPTVMSGYLSDAVLSYSKLRRTLRNTPMRRRRMVVNNSWGMFDPQWDFPIGHPGNYSDNAAHPFNIIVASLEAEGADILFAAGNCGRDCPDSRCRFGRTRPICGANSHPRVLSVAGIDVRKRRIGYSSQGPGRLFADKPDISAYTHFRGSGVYPEDGGTSAACPVAAGVIAAVRSKYSASQFSPATLRTIVYKSAEDIGGPGYDYNHGWGAIDPDSLTSRLGWRARRKSTAPSARRKTTAAAGRR